MRAKPRILVLHSLYAHSRKTVRQHLACYDRYLEDVDVVYHHYRAPITQSLFASTFDLIVLNFCVLSTRHTPAFREILDTYAFLPNMGCPIVAVPQDDFLTSAYLDEWLYRWDVHAIYSPLDKGLDRLYPHSGRKSRLEHVLTGYVDESLIAIAPERALPHRDRPIDVGCRVNFLPYRCGRFGRLKGEQATQFGQAAEAAGFAVDVSTRPEDTFVTGLSWYDFLGRSRFTVAQHGGSSLIDPYGDVTARINEYTADRPDAPFDEVEASCFPGLDGPEDLSAIGPRIFDAALMRTCLILGSGDYLDMRPFEHYLPLEDDLSNSEELFEAMRDEALVETLVQNAWDELIASGRYTYREMAERVVYDNLEQRQRSNAIGDLEEQRALIESLETARARMGHDLFESFRRLMNQAQKQGTLSRLRRCLDAATPLEALDSAVLGSPTKGLSKLRRPELETLRQIRVRNAREGGLSWLDCLEDGLLDPLGRDPWLSLDPKDAATH